MGDVDNDDDNDNGDDDGGGGDNDDDDDDGRRVDNNDDGVGNYDDDDEFLKSLWNDVYYDHYYDFGKKCEWYKAMNIATRPPPPPPVALIELMAFFSSSHLTLYSQNVLIIPIFHPLGMRSQHRGRSVWTLQGRLLWRCTLWWPWCLQDLLVSTADRKPKVSFKFISSLFISTLSKIT